MTMSQKLNYRKQKSSKEIHADARFEKSELKSTMEYKSEREEQEAGRQPESAEKKRSVSNGCFNAAGAFFRRLAIEKRAVEYQRR